MRGRTHVLQTKNHSDKMSKAVNPYGNGKPAERIYKVLSKFANKGKVIGRRMLKALEKSLISWKFNT